jgi:hypothetical protein
MNMGSTVSTVDTVAPEMTRATEARFGACEVAEFVMSPFPLSVPPIGQIAEPTGQVFGVA